MSFEEFINQAWDDHAVKTHEVAEKLRHQSVAQSASEIVQVAGLVTHVFGEHLGQWDDGIRVLQALKQPDEETKAAIERSIASLELSSGKPQKLKTLTTSDQIRVLAVSASALSEQKQAAKAEQFFRDALTKAHGLKREDPANRALAVTGNNLACALEEKKSRSKDETTLMITAAEAARKYWEIAGTWLHVERAEYRLANTYMKADDLARALKHAQECLRICQANNADETELKYANEILNQVKAASKH